MHSPRLMKWLPLRTSSPQAPPPKPDARRCLPRMEPLDDRILLSAAVANGGDAGQALVALLKGQITIVSNELALLKADGNLVTQDQKLNGDYQKLTNSLIQFDDSLNNLGDALLKIASDAKLSDTQITAIIDAETQKVDTAFLKIHDANATFSKIATASASLEEVLTGDKASLFQGLLSVVPVPGSATEAQTDNFLKISDSFQKIDQAIVDIGSDTSVAKPSGNGGDKNPMPIETITINFGKITNEYTPRITDPSLQQTITGLANETLALIPNNPGQVG